MRLTPTSLKVFIKITSVVFIIAQFISVQAQNRPDVVWQRAHSGEVNSVAFSPDGQILATASEDKTVKLWRVSDGTLLRTLGPHFQYVKSVAISPDNQIVASAGGDYLIRMWRISDGRLVRTIDSGTYPLVFSPDGQWLIGGVRIYRVSDGEWWGYHRAFPRGLSFSPDGQVIAGGEHYGGHVALGRGSDWSDQQLVEPHTEGVNSTAFSPDGHLLASAGYDKTIRFSRMPDGTLLRTIPADVFYSIYAVAFSPDGQTVAASGEVWPPDHGVISFWRVSDGSPLLTYTQDTGLSVDTFAFSSDGRYIAYGRDDGAVVLARNPFAPCSASLASTSAFFSLQGGSGSVNVTSGCGWNATSNNSWITLTSEPGGSGNGVVTYEIRENFTGSARSGSLTIASRTYTVIQDGGASGDCTYAISPGLASYSSSGGSGTVNITCEARCAWQAVSNASWITITSSSEGIGNGAIAYTVAVNPTITGRKGTIRIGNQTFSVKQKGGSGGTK